MRRVALLSTVLLGTLSGSAFAQTSDRGWVDLSYVSATPLETGQTYTFNTRLFQEPASLTAVYPELPRVQGLLSGAGVRIAGGFGAGVLFTRLNYEFNADLEARIPHPNLFNRIGTGTGVTVDPLERSDKSLDLSVAYQPPTSDVWRIRLFAGPTYFKVKQDFVEDIRYTQVFNNVTGANTITITGYQGETVDDSTWGFHAGADVAYFFSRYFGVGAGLRFNRGTVKIDHEPMSEVATEMKVGSAILGAGLRVRF